MEGENNGLDPVAAVELPNTCPDSRASFLGERMPGYNAPTIGQSLVVLLFIAVEAALPCDEIPKASGHETL